MILIALDCFHQKERIHLYPYFFGFCLGLAVVVPLGFTVGASLAFDGITGFSIDGVDMSVMGVAIILGSAAVHSDIPGVPATHSIIGFAAVHNIAGVATVQRILGVAPAHSDGSATVTVAVALLEGSATLVAVTLSDPEVVAV
jgi:hypothetical protein